MMKIPKLTAEISVGAAAGIYRTGPHAGGQAAVIPMATLACLSACVGSATAAHCAARCADQDNAEACWQQCANPADPGCIQYCFMN